jgi:hypothetical protein
VEWARAEIQNMDLTGCPILLPGFTSGAVVDVRGLSFDDLHNGPVFGL